MTYIPRWIKIIKIALNTIDIQNIELFIFMSTDHKSVDYC